MAGLVVVAEKVKDPGSLKGLGFGADEQPEETDWFNVSPFGRLADTCNEYLTKGCQVYIEGSRSKGRAYEGRDGKLFPLMWFWTRCNFCGASLVALVAVSWSRSLCTNHLRCSG